MYSAKGYQLRKEEYNYLLPVLKTKMFESGDRRYFTGSFEDLEDMLNRLKGLYDNYDELGSMVAYNCSKEGSIASFREKMKKQTIQFRSPYYELTDKIVNFKESVKGTDEKLEQLGAELSRISNEIHKHLDSKYIWD